MKKILFIAVHPPYLYWEENEWARREYRDRWLPRQAKALGYEAGLFFLSNSARQWIYPDEVEVAFLPVDDVAADEKSHTSRVMQQRIEEDCPDLIVFKGLGYRLSSWILEETGFGIPFAFIVGGGTEDPYLHRASFVLAETEEQRSSFLLLGLRAAVLPKALDLSVFKPSSTKLYDIVNVGPICDVKNQVALKSLSYEFSIAFVGDGPDMPRIREGFSSKASFLGRLDVKHVSETIRHSRLMVHPSLSEGFPRVIMESFACGVPVVAIRQTVKNGFEHGRQGLLVDSSELDDAVEQLLRNPEALGRMSAECLRTASACSKESTIPVLENMLKTVFAV